MDSNYIYGAETVNDRQNGKYNIEYTISNANTVTNTNSSEASWCQSGNYCHRTCTININSSDGRTTTLQLALYNGNETNSGTWNPDYVSYAITCRGQISSHYFLDNKTCATLIWDGNNYVAGYPDVDYAISKKNSPN